MSNYTFEASDVRGNGLRAPLSSAGGWWSLMERVAADVTEGRRGRIVTEALIGSGLAPDAGSIRAKYEANKGTIDGYFDEVDQQRLIRMAHRASADAAQDTAAKVAWLGAAYVAGLVSMHIWNRRNSL